MSATLTTAVHLTTIQAAYGHSLEQVREQLQPLALVTEYRDVVKAIASCRSLRVQVEERRKMLKADSMEYGRNVDAVAKRLTETIEAFEEPLKMRKAEADAAKAREKAAKEQAEREAREAEARAKIEAEQAEARKQRAAEERELTQRRAEIEKMKREAEAQAAAERAELVELRRQLALERSQAATDAARAAEQLRKLDAAREAETLRARMAAEAEENRLANERHERELEAKRQAAMPDRALLSAWADAFRRVQSPNCSTGEGRALVIDVEQRMLRLSAELHSFDGTPEQWSDPDPHATLRTFGEVVDANVR